MAKHITNLKMIVKGASIGFIGLFLSKLITYLYRALLSKLGPEKYGTFSLALALFGFVVGLSLLGIENGVVRYVSFFRGKKDNKKIKGVVNFALKTTLLTGLFFTAILFLFSERISLIFNNPELYNILRIIALSIPFYIAYKIFTSALRGLQRIDYETWTVVFVENLGKLVLSFIAIAVGFNLIGVSFGYSAAIFLSMAVAFALYKKEFPFKIKKPEYLSKEVLLFSLPLLLNNILYLIMGWTDTVMIGYFRGAYDVGIYNSALPTAALLTGASIALLGLFIPVITELVAKKDYKNIKKLYGITARWNFLINLPIFLILAFFSRPILSLIFGKVYSAASTPLIILASGYFIYSTLYACNNLLHAFKRTKVIFYCSLIATIINIILNYVLIQKIGINGAAIATAISIAIISILWVYESYKILKFIPISIKFFLILILEVGLLLLMDKFIFINKTIPILVLIFIIYILIHLILTFAMRLVEKEDLVILKGIVNKIKNIIPAKDEIQQ